MVSNTKGILVQILAEKGCLMQKRVACLLFLSLISGKTNINFVVLTSILWQYKLFGEGEILAGKALVLQTQKPGFKPQEHHTNAWHRVPETGWPV